MTQIQEVKSARNSFNHFESDFLLPKNLQMKISCALKICGCHIVAEGMFFIDFCKVYYPLNFLRVR